MISFKNVPPFYMPKMVGLKDYEHWENEKRKLKDLQKKADDLKISFQIRLQKFILMLETSPFLNEEIISKGARGAEVRDTPVLSLLEYLQEQLDLKADSLYQFVNFMLKQLKLDKQSLFEKVSLAWKTPLNEFHELAKSEASIAEEIRDCKQRIDSLEPFKLMFLYLKDAFIKALDDLYKMAMEKGQADISEACSILKAQDCRNEEMLIQTANKYVKAPGSLHHLVYCHSENLKKIHQQMLNLDYYLQLNSLKQLLIDYLKQREQVKDEYGQIKEYFYGSFFASFQKSYTQKKAAVQALLAALAGEPQDLKVHLSVLRNGYLGQQLRSFIKQGFADVLVGHEVRTVSDFVTQLSRASYPGCQYPGNVLQC